MNLFLTLFLSLLIAHVIIDFYCSPNRIFKNKPEPKRFRLLFHALLHALAASIPILFITQNMNAIFCLLFIVAISHYLIDLMTVYIAQYNDAKLRSFIINQTLHIALLVGISLHASGVGFSVVEQVDSLLTSKHMAIMLGYSIILKPVSTLIGLVLVKHTPQEFSQGDGLFSAGEMIGYLERLLIFTFIINDQYAVIGFVLAAKSIFRFGELNTAKRHKLTEYVLLGSFLSITITALLGVLLKQLI